MPSTLTTTRAASGNDRDTSSWIVSMISGLLSDEMSFYETGSTSFELFCPLTPSPVRCCAVAAENSSSCPNRDELAQAAGSMLRANRAGRCVQASPPAARPRRHSPRRWCRAAAAPPSASARGAGCRRSRRRRRALHRHPRPPAPGR
jgi:hypothetical protein